MVLVGALSQPSLKAETQSDLDLLCAVFQKFPMFAVLFRFLCWKDKGSIPSSLVRMNKYSNYSAQKGSAQELLEATPAALP